MPQQTPQLMLIPKPPSNAMVLWGRPSEVKSYTAFAADKTQKAAAGSTGEPDLSGPLLVGFLVTAAAILSLGYAWKKARSLRTQVPAAILGIGLLFAGAFAFSVGFRLQAGQTAATKKERDHWLGIAEIVINEILVERQASTRGFLRALDRRHMLYSSPKWLMVIDFHKDRYLAIPAGHVVKIDAPPAGSLPTNLSREPRMEDTVISFIPDGRPQFAAAGAGPFTGLGPVRITTNLVQPAEIYLQRGDQADLSPADEFIKRVAYGLDPVEHFRLRSNLSPN